MAATHRIIIGVVMLQICIQTTSSNVLNLENKANVEEAASNQKQLTLEDDTTYSTKQGKREKRWFDPFGFGLSPFFPPIVANFAKRADSYESTLDDPLPHIFRRLQEVNNLAKEPSYNYPQPHKAQPFPFFVPIFYIPSEDCSCGDSSEQDQSKFVTTTRKPRPTTQVPEKDQSNRDPNSRMPIDQLPGVDKRLPEMDDKRQNWGIVVNQTQPEDDSYFDNRPLSFEPLGPPPPEPGIRPSPPVDHGISQVDTGSSPPAPEAAPATGTPAPPQASSPSPAMPPIIPSSCDGAILTCCHQPQITYECFEANGCLDPLALGSPCDVDAILKSINRFQRFYGQRK